MTYLDKLKQWIAKQPMTGATGGGNHTGMDLLMRALDEVHTERDAERERWVKDTSEFEMTPAEKEVWFLLNQYVPEHALKRAQDAHREASEQRHESASTLARAVQKAEERADAERTRWQDATGLECGGDPDGVTPEGLAKYLRTLEDRAEQAERERDEALAEVAHLRSLAENYAAAEGRLSARLIDAEAARERAEAAYAEANERWRTASQDASAFRDRCERAEAALREKRGVLSAALEQVRQALAARGGTTPGGGLIGILNGVDGLADRAERAEADNAALLKEFATVSMCIAKLSASATPLASDFRAALEQLAGDLQRTSLQMRGQTGTRRHPGAALLERLRAAEAVLRSIEHIESRDPNEGMRYCPACGECEAGHTDECALCRALGVGR